jgi:hypothetical protein
VRARDNARGVAFFAREADRRASFWLGGNGTARGDGVCGGFAAKKFGWDKARFCGESGEGEFGEFGVDVGDLVVSRRNLDGDPERERRNDLTADVTST